MVGCRDRCSVAAARNARAVEGIVVVTDPSIVHVAGEVDIATAAEFRAALVLCEEQPAIRTLCLSEVVFFSAAGVGCFVEREWPTRPHPAILGSAAVRRVLEMCGLDFMLESLDGSTGCCVGLAGREASRG